MPGLHIVSTTKECYIAVDSWNGEGYSQQPSYAVINKNDWLPFVAEKLTEYPDVDNLTGFAFKKLSFSYNSGEDGGALHLLKKPASKVMLLEVMTDINEASCQLFDNFDDAYKALSERVNCPDMAFDKDDVIEFMEGGLNEFASHSDDGEFFAFAIIG